MTTLDTLLIMILMFRNFPVAVLACTAVLLRGCSAGAIPAHDAKPAVVVSFYPFEFLAQRVGGDLVTVTNLTQPGAEPHDMELTPRQVAQVAKASLVVYQRGFQPAVDSAIDSERPMRVLEATSVVPLHEADEPDSHGHAGNDPHAWLDPTSMSAYGSAVAQRLAEIDPAHADVYATNAQKLTQEMSALDQAFSTGLAQCDRRVFVTSHEAFSYLANRYHLTQIAISGVTPDVEPTASRVAEVQKLARTYHVTTIFYETIASPAVSKAIAGDLGLKTDVLDPLEGITAESRGTDYTSVMTSNLTALKEANGCH